MKYFIANWKAHKGINDGIEWLQKFVSLINNDPKITYDLENGHKKIIICPPYPLIFPLKEHLPPLSNFHVGSQDISSYDEGSFTGEVSGVSLQELVEYSLIGHSERRSHFNEDNTNIQNKISLAQKYNIHPILCVRGKDDVIPEKVNIIAYEPSEYIGTGKSQELTKIIEMRKSLNISQECLFLYGAGITERDVSSILSANEIDGLLVGSASLDPQSFYTIVSSI